MNDNLLKLVERLEVEPETNLCASELRNNTGNVCVHGLACIVYQEETSRGSWQRAFDGRWQFVVDGHVGTIAMPGVVLDWYGIGRSVRDDAKEESLMHMNDAEFLSFKEMAARIRELDGDVTT